jgi:hypothetical protein
MRGPLCVGALACILSGPAAQAAVVEEFTVQDWSGLAVRDEETGRLSSCAIYSKFQNGATLFLIKHAEGGWALSLVHASWGLSEGGSYPLRYRIDREAYVEDVSTALGSDQIGVTIPDDDPLITQLRRGKLLTVQFQGREYGFELSNSGKALQAAQDCLEQRRDPAGPQIAVKLDPPEPDSAPQVPAAEPAGVARMQPGPGSEPSAPDLREVFGPWVVSVARDEAGRFLNCTAFNVRGGDQLMMSHYPDEFWDISLYRSSWALETDRSYRLIYSIDGQRADTEALAHNAEAVEPTRILFESTSSDDLVNRMSGGREIAFELQGGARGPQILRYRLDRAAEAFAAARECTRRNTHGI